MSTVSTPAVVSTTKPVIASTSTTKDKKNRKAPVTPAPSPTTLANASGDEQAKAIILALNGSYAKTAAAILAECKGNTVLAATLVGDDIRITLHKIARIVPLLRNSAPSTLFTDGNNRGARVGELFASRLGLSSLYRDTTRANLKDARAALVESAK